MCHGQLVNEALYRAKKPGSCDRCDAPIPKRRRFYFGTSRGDDDGRLANFRLCMTCAALDAVADEGMGCSIGDGGDDQDHRDDRESIASGLRKLRARIGRRIKCKGSPRP